MLSFQDYGLSKHVKINLGAEAAVKYLGEFAKATMQAAEIIQQHQKWLEITEHRYFVVSMEMTGQIAKLRFENYNQEILEIFYNIKERKFQNFAVGNLLLKTGMSSQYLQGVMDILGAFESTSQMDGLARTAKFEHAQSQITKNHHLLKSADYQKLMKILLDEEFLEKINNNNLRDVIDSYSLFLHGRTARKTKIRLDKLLAQATQLHNMPSPPGPFCKAKDTEGMGKRSGIYFGWRQSNCFYVGKSTNIESRLRSHHVITPDDDVSWLEMPTSEIHLNELFYIWLLAPECNKESRQSDKKLGEETAE